MAGRKGSGEKTPATLPRPAGKWVKRNAPGARGESADAPTQPRHPTLEVNSRWLIPSIPEVERPKRSERPPMPPPLPSSLAVKPRGKLPPPLPREDGDVAPTPAAKSRSDTQRASRRPPRAR